MAAPSAKATTLSLYRTMLRAGAGFTQYNMRDYAMRSVRIRFREHMELTDPPAIAAALADARQNLKMIQRQATVSQLFPTAKHCMEEGGEEIVEGSRFPGDPKAH